MRILWVVLKRRTFIDTLSIDCSMFCRVSKLTCKPWKRYADWKPKDAQFITLQTEALRSSSVDFSRKVEGPLFAGQRFIGCICKSYSKSSVDQLFQLILSYNCNDVIRLASVFQR